MAYFLFIDESGQDRGESPYEVLAGIAIEDKKLWPLILELRDAETGMFGRRYSDDASELKAKKILKKKTFRLASRTAEMPIEERRPRAKACLDDGASADYLSLAALAQTKIVFTQVLLDICKKYECKVFASILATNEREYNPDYLRKDYSYLFERFFYFLEDQPQEHCGIVVFDELEKSRSHILLRQLSLYFKETQTGRERASKVIPEALFVHSDLTTGIQLADIAAYLLSWGFRTGELTKAARQELLPLVRQVARLRYKAVRVKGRLGSIDIWSIAIISELRSRDERRKLAEPLGPEIEKGNVANDKASADNLPFL